MKHLLIILLITCSCHPAYYKQMKNTQKIEITYTDGSVGYVLVEIKGNLYLSHDSCLMMTLSGEAIRCGVRKYKKL